MWIFQHFQICIITPSVGQWTAVSKYVNAYSYRSWFLLPALSSSPPSLVIPKIFNTSVLNPTAGKRCLASQSASSAADHLHVMIHPELTIRADYQATRPSWVCVCLCQPFSFSRIEKIRFEQKGIVCHQGSGADTSEEFGDLKSCAAVRGGIQELRKSAQQSFLIGICSIALYGNALSVAKVAKCLVDWGSVHDGGRGPFCAGATQMATRLAGQRVLDRETSSSQQPDKCWSWK